MDVKKIGMFIQTERKKLNITQDELAQKICVSNKAVSKWENGHGMPSIDYLVILAKTFNVTVNELLQGERLSDQEKITKADETIIKGLKNKKYVLFLKIIAGCIGCLCLCLLEAILYIARVPEVYAYLIFALFLVMAFVTEFATKNKL